jgi:prepilin-type N-terminal cleavage/methylation domain-containing protein
LDLPKPQGQQRRRSFGSEKGFSLIEVLLAAVILGIAVISFSYLFGAAGSDIVRLGSERVSLHVAQQEMEDLLRLPYNDPELTVTNGFDHYRRFKRPPGPVKTADLEGELFLQWQVMACDDPYGSGQDYKRITLELYDDFLDGDSSWVGSHPGVQPEERVVTVSTFIVP